MNYQEWIDYLTGLVSVPDYIDEDTKAAYFRFSERLKDIIRYHDELGVKESDCVRLLSDLKFDIVAWNEKGGAK